MQYWKSKLWQPIVLFAVVLTAAGAVLYVTRSQGDATTTPAGSAERRSMTADPLKIVLTPLGGDTQADTQIADLQRRIAEAPEKNMLLERLGWTFVAKARVSSDPGFYTLAEQAAKAIIATAPDDAAAALLLGHTHHAMHRFADAEAIARKLNSQREFVFDYALLGDALMEQGKLEEAVVAYQKMVDLKPSLQTYSRVAHMRWLKGDLAGAIEASRRAVAAGSPRDAEPLAWASARLAFYQLQEGDVSSAVRNTDHALEILPGYAPAALVRGRLLLAQGNAEEAVVPLRGAADASPLPENLWALADALRATGNIPEAEAVEAQLSTTGATTDPRTYSLFLASRGQDPALALRLAAAELESRQDVFTYDALAWAQLASGDVAQARENIQRALAEGTRDGRLYYHAGAIAMAAGVNAEALEFLDQARRLERMLLPSERQALDRHLTALIAGTSQLSVN
jgi:tetratricopeptide (TPR) repeat protein